MNKKRIGSAIAFTTLLIFFAGSNCYGMGVDPCVVNEGFETTAVGNGSVPDGWYTYWTHQYVGVVEEVEWLTTVHRLRVSSPTWGHGRIGSAFISDAGTSFGAACDFRAVSGVNFSLMQFAVTGYGTFGGVVLQPNAANDPNLLDIHNGSGEFLTSIKVDKWYHLVIEVNGLNQTIYLNDHIIGHADVPSSSYERLMFGPGGTQMTDSGTVYYDDVYVGEFIPPFYLVNATLIDEGFDSAPVANGSLPEDWIAYWTHQYVGVSDDYSVSDANSLRVSSPSWGHGAVGSPTFTTAGTTFALQFDFYPSGAYTDYRLVGLGSSSGEFAYFMLQSTPEGLCLYNMFDEHVATLDSSFWSTFVIVWDQGFYTAYINDLVIDQGQGDDKVLSRFLFGPGGADMTDSGTVYYDNVKLGDANFPSSCAQVWDWEWGLKADFNHDCYVNLADLAIFCNGWMRCNEPSDERCENPLLD